MAVALDPTRPRVRPDQGAPHYARCQSCRAKGRRLYLVSFGEAAADEPTFAVCGPCAKDARHATPWDGDVAEAFA